MAMRGRGAGLFQGLKARDESRQKDEQLAIQRQNADASAMRAASAGSDAFWAHQTARERSDLERQRLEITQGKQDDAAVRDDFSRRAQKMELEKNTVEAQKLAELNRQEIERMQNRRQMYETIEGEAFFATATSGMFSDDGSIKTNTPAFEEELARRLGVKRASAYLDKNGFHIRYESNGGKVGTKDFDTDWCKSQSLYWAGDASMFGGGRIGKDGREQIGEGQRQAMEVASYGRKKEMEVASYGRKKAIDQEMYLQNRGDVNLQSVLRSLAVEVGKGNMTDAEADAAAKWYTGFLEAQKKAQAPAPAPTATTRGGRGAASPAPQNGGEDRRAALQRRLAEIEAQKAGRGESRRNIPGMPKRQGEQPDAAPQGGDGEPQGRQVQQRQPVGKTRSERAQQFADAGLTAQSVAKEYGIDEGKAEAAINRAKGKYLRGETGGQSLESVILAEVAWQQRMAERKSAREGRRSRRGEQ